MESYTIPIGKFFDDKVCLLVPLFQRPYVWKREDQWEPLWADIVSVCNRVSRSSDPRPHFIGAVVLEVLPRKVGQLDRRLVIDGQQRLTTLQILLRAFADALPDVEEYSRLRRDVVELVLNSHSHVKEEWEKYKLWPTNSDREAFANVMSGKGLEFLHKTYRATVAMPRLVDAYFYFRSQLDDRLRLNEPGFKERAEQFQTAITQCLNIVAIDIEDQDDSQVIFETLNARGTPLLPADLIKNAILSRARWEKCDEEALYAKYWQIFDTETYWREEVGRGHARRARIDLFLQNYLTVQTLEEVSTSHLYATYRDWMNREEKSAVWYSADINRYALVYRRLQMWTGDDAERVYLSRLSVLGIVTSGPFLLELFNKHHDTRRSEVQQTLRDVDSFLYRRTICGLNTRGYNRLFLDLTKIVATDPDFVGAVRKQLESSGAASVRWPSDSEFKQAWLTRPIAIELRPERVRAILEAIEVALRSAKTESLTFNKPLQVEHLMPVSWEQHYLTSSSDPEVIELRNRALQTIGNLSLLTESLNPAISNGPWDHKRTEILKHSALALNRSLPQGPWDEEQITARGTSLFEVARRVWSGPSREHEYSVEDVEDLVLAESLPDQGESGPLKTGRFSPVKFRDDCFPKIGRALGTTLRKKTQAIWVSEDRAIAVLCITGRAFEKINGAGFWFAFHPHQQDELRTFNRAYVAFACGSPENVISIPFEEFRQWLPTLNKTVLSDRTYWHVKIRQTNGQWANYPKAGNPPRDLMQYLIAPSV